jgi:hypothetical protein
MDEAEVAAKAGRYEEALAGFLWCFDYGQEADEAFAGVHGSFLVHDILTLAKVYPPARQALLARRDERAGRLSAGTASLDDAFDFVAINRYLGQQEFTLRVFKATQSGTKQWEILGWGIREFLLERRSYEELLRIFDPETELAQQFRSLNVQPCDGDRRFTSHLKDKLVRACAPLVEALAALGQHERARALADGILRVIRTESVVTRLVGHAERSGDTALTEYLRGRRSKPRKT